MTYEEILEVMKEEDTFLSGLCIGLIMLQQYHGWTVQDWPVEFDDISSDYSLLRTTIQQLIDQTGGQR